MNKRKGANIPPVNGENTREEFSILKDFIRAYFKRLEVLVTQVPYDLRGLLLPRYMLYTGFKSRLYVDPTGRLGFEVIRERASRFSIKTERIEERVEQKIFGILGRENMFIISGKGAELRRLILTCKDFVEIYGHYLPEESSILVFSRPNITGPLKVEKNAEVKIVNCYIYWTIKGKRYVKFIPFAWIFGDVNTLIEMDPCIHAESNFYSSLFGRLHEIITHGYGKPTDERTYLRTLELYSCLLYTSPSPRDRG